MLWIYFPGWFGLAVLAIINGTVREKCYRKRLGELRAHQVSTVSLLALMSVFVWLLARFWPLESAARALVVGGVWLAATVLFEFGFGHFVMRKPWPVLLHDYNLSKGRIWALILVWTFLSPLVFYSF